MLISLKGFVDQFLYHGQLVEVSDVGPDESNDSIRYEGNQEYIPESLYGAAVRYVAMNGRDDDPYTVRIECDFETNVQPDATDVSKILADFVGDFFYPGQNVEISGIGPDDDGNFVRYDGAVEEIPDELKKKHIGYVASAARSEAPHTLRIECFDLLPVE